MKQESVKVEGMTCQRCVQTIRNALVKISGLNTININLDAKEVGVTFNDNETSLQEIIGKIIEAGFELPEKQEKK